MSKKDDVADLLGEEGGDAKPAKKAAAPKKEAAAPAAKKAPAKAVKEEAKPAAKKAAVPKKEAAPEAKERPAREPITFEEGEREELYKKIKQKVKKPINSRELAEKLEIPTRKLRIVLYSMAKREEITLEPGESKVTGMTVSPA